MRKYNNLCRDENQEIIEVIIILFGRNMLKRVICEIFSWVREFF